MLIKTESNRKKAVNVNHWENRFANFVTHLQITHGKTTFGDGLPDFEECKEYLSFVIFKGSAPVKFHCDMELELALILCNFDERASIYCMNSIQGPAPSMKKHSP